MLTGQIGGVMRYRNLPVVGAIAIVFTSSIAEAKPPRKPDMMELIAAAHENGYNEGYLAGHDAAIGGDRLKVCDMLLRSAEERLRDAKRYEDCLKQLKSAVHGPVSYLRQIAFQCVGELK